MCAQAAYLRINQCMKIKFDNSIGVRLLKVVFGCYLIVTIIVTLVQLYLEYSNVEKNILIELYNVSRSFEDGIATGLWNVDADSVQSIVRGISESDVISGVRVDDHNGQVQAFHGGFIEQAVKPNNVRVISFDAKEARELHIEIDGKNETVYEFSLDIHFVEEPGAKPEVVGKTYLYASGSTVIKRFTYSFFLVVVNSLIKTGFLWLIFLVATNKMVAMPLGQLTKATRNLDKNTNKDSYVKEILEDISSTKHKDEFHILANSFLKMHGSIVRKLDNLNQLNNLSISLAQTHSKIAVFEAVVNFVQQSFVCQRVYAVNSDGEIFWSNCASGDKNLMSNLTLGIDDNSFNAIRRKGSIVYKHKIAEHTCASNEELADNPENHSILYLPLNDSDGKVTEIWFLGASKESCLDKKFDLSQEALGFLRILSSIACETLKNINHDEVIKNHNKMLERRVYDRTKELEQLNKELEHLAVHDSLTSLPNRILFKDRLDYLIKSNNRSKIYFSVISIDLTEFKHINDTYGHDAGDIVLKAVAKRFSDTLRKTDTIARIGGDEFSGIIINNGPNSNNHIKKVVSRLNKSLEKAIPISSNDSVLVGANIGASFFPEHSTDAELLVKYSDVAMYDAKRSSKRYSVFNPQENKKVKEYFQVMFHLEDAIDKNQLLLHYQPIFDLKTNYPISFEALVRWNHPEKGMVPPGEFIPHAEKNGLIMPLTEWVVKEASKQCAKWRNVGYDFAVSVNISPRVFSANCLHDRLGEIIEEHKLEPRNIKLEITETTAMEQPEIGMDVINKLSNMGFLISIDDFGTGHSSLSYLTQLPLSELKIDRSFIISESANSFVVVQTIIDLAKALDLYVVAEGIENEENITC